MGWHPSLVSYLVAWQSSLGQFEQDQINFSSKGDVCCGDTAYKAART